jgi:flagellar assembly protein FliH
MASRLISGDKAAAAQALVWRGTNEQQSGARKEGKTGASSQQSGGGVDEQQLRVFMAQQARLQEMERELESRPKQAYQRGYDEGQTAGIQAANARLEPVIAKLASSIKDLATVRKRHLMEAEEDAVRLALAVAHRILHRELSVDPESLLGVVKAVFERVDGRDVHRVRLHPDDVPILQRHLAAVGMPPRVELVPDTGLERGSVIVDTNRGSLDASVSSQLKEIERGLVDLVRRWS